MENKNIDQEINEAETLGIKVSKVSMTGFKSKKPEEYIKEEKRQKTLVAKRTEKRIAKAKEDARKKPIDKRRELLASRFKAVKTRNRAITYSDANIKAWLEEYDIIVHNPKSWNKITKNGTIPFTPSNKKKKTARDLLDAMDLE